MATRSPSMWIPSKKSLCFIFYQARRLFRDCGSELRRREGEQGETECGRSGAAERASASAQSADGCGRGKGALSGRRQRNQGVREHSIVALVPGEMLSRCLVNQFTDKGKPGTIYPLQSGASSQGSLMYMTKRTPLSPAELRQHLLPPTDMDAERSLPC